MRISHTRPAPRRGDVTRWGRSRARVAGTWLATVALFLVAVAPAYGGAGPTRLFDANVAPRSGAPDTTITFTVGYRNREGSPADWVRVKVAGGTHAMHLTGSSDDWKRKVTFTWSGKLPAGTHTVTFEAMSRDRFDDTLGAGSVTISVPSTPTPKPTPSATPKPTPKPTPKATPRATDRPAASPTDHLGPTATPTVGSHQATAAPTPTSPSPTANGGSPTPSDDAIGAVVGGTIIGGGTPGIPPDATGGSSGGSSGGPNGPEGPTDGSPGGSGGDPASVGGAAPGGSSGSSDGGDPIAVFGSAVGVLTGRGPAVPLGLVTTMVTTTGVVTAAMAFGMFGKRRRDGDQPDSDEALARSAGRGLGVGATALATVPARVVIPAPVPGPSELEMDMPRWRRPSLMEARRADPVRDAAPPAPRLTFDSGLVGPLDGRERRLIRYNVVRLLDTPDELRGGEIGFLDQGDEVQLLEKHGVYWLVLCPDGSQGWIHKMTLGDVVGGEPGRASPTATMPMSPDTWTMGEDVDADVLSAYLESRRRS